MSNIITDIVALAGAAIGLVALGLSLYNTWKQRVRGPEYVIPWAYVTQKWFLDGNQEPNCRIMFLLQNVGD